MNPLTPSSLMFLQQQTSANNLLQYLLTSLSVNSTVILCSRTLELCSSPLAELVRVATCQQQQLV